MKYRKFGRLDWKASALGFGLERLPTIDNNPDKIDAGEAVKMLRCAIDRGVNYVDAGAEPLLKRNSQLLREARRDGYRQKIKIAATLASFKIRSAADFDRQLEDLLKWLDEDCVDFLLLGGLNRESWPRLDDLGITKRAEAAIAEKKIRYIGFFFHDQYQFLREIIEAYNNWTLCQFHYSYMDIDHHPGASGLTYASDKGLAVVAAKPLMGGRLTKEPPEEVGKIWAEAEPQRPPAEWGLRWVWNHPEAATVVCDMSSLEQVKANIALADSAKAGGFTVPEELVISRVRDAYQKLKPIPCTACRGCMPCGLGIDVPRIFEIYNDAAMTGDIATGREIYRRERHRIEDCNECGTCAGKCGMRIPIIDWLKKVRPALAGD